MSLTLYWWEGGKQPTFMLNGIESSTQEFILVSYGPKIFLVSTLLFFFLNLFYKTSTTYFEQNSPYKKEYFCSKPQMRLFEQKYTFFFFWAKVSFIKFWAKIYVYRCLSCFSSQQYICFYDFCKTVLVKKCTP